VIETDRLRIGPSSAEERDVLAAIWLDSANERLHATVGEEQVRQWVADAWGVTEKATGDLIGDCTVFFADEHDAWELAYGLRRDRWGLGYATEAAQACVRHALEELGLERIVADVEPDNTASIRVLEKCGFVLLGGTPESPVYVVMRR
jgi:RimJ/RimL family protein N-acetyltransferase